MLRAALRQRVVVDQGHPQAWRMSVAASAVSLRIPVAARSARTIEASWLASHPARQRRSRTRMCLAQTRSAALLPVAIAELRDPFAHFAHLIVCPSCAD